MSNSISELIVEYRYMETSAGLMSPLKPAITLHFGMIIAKVAITDTIFLTKLQKRENRPNNSPLDIMKMQVA